MRDFRKLEPQGEDFVPEEVWINGEKLDPAKAGQEDEDAPDNNAQ